MLELRILTGQRRNERIVLDPKSQVRTTTSLPYLLELEAVELTLSPENIELVTHAKVLLEDTTIELSPVYCDENNLVAFRASPSRKDGRMQALFYNYFGVAILYAEIHYKSSIELIELGQLEVLARKASVEQVESMVEFIISTNEDTLLRARGATRRKAGVIDESAKSPQRLLEQLENSVDNIEELLPYILQSPISSLSTKMEILPGSPELDLQEQGIAWLGENIGVLEPCDDPESELLRWQGQSLQARETQASVMFENRDIYENRIVLGYIESLLEFTSEVMHGVSETNKCVSLNSHDGYLSFFATVASRLLSSAATQLLKAQVIHERLRAIRHVMCSYLSVRVADRSYPRFTPKVRANRHYSALFRSIHEWYLGAKLDWSAHKLLLAIDNIPKLFELYSILVVRNWCQEHGREVSENRDALWMGEIDGFNVELFYEPKYWMVGHVNQSGMIFNTENRKLNSAKNDRVGKVRTGKYEHRSPDIVLAITRKGRKPSLLILDAKYTDKQLAFETHLPECVMKYVHGIASTATPSLVASMFILFPDGGGDGGYFDFHAHPFGVFGSSPQLPMLGAQGLSFGVNGREHHEDVSKLLNAALTNLDREFNLTDTGYTA